MGLLFAAFREGSCSLCGSTQNLTGEHKIKASALRSEFGPDSMMIGRFGEPNENMKLAQGVKSEIFHFASQLCAPCNNSRSQAADREFDRFHTIARDLMAKGEDPNHVFNNARYAVTSEAYLNVFRYFAKLLCCHLADVGAPRPVHMSRFALGQVNTNCVWLDVNHDWTYQQTSVEFGPHKYAAHGGLAIYGDAKTGGANAFHSTLTVGSLRYVFYSRLNWFERLELRLAHRNFYEFCREQVQKSIDRPLSQEDYLRLGLTAKQPTEK